MIHVCVLFHELCRRRCTTIDTICECVRADASDHHWMVLQEPEAQMPLGVPPLLVPSTPRSISSPTSGVPGASPVGSSSHKCQQHRTENDLAWQSVQTSATTAPTARRKLCLPTWMNVAMPLSTSRETLKTRRCTSMTVTLNRSSSPSHQQSTMALPVVFHFSSVSTFQNDHNSPRPSDCSRACLCAFPFFPLTCWPFLPLSPYTASISTGASSQRRWQAWLP